MNPNRHCVFIRVCHRMEDLRILVDIIRKHWTNGSYFILIASNGKSLGYDIPPEVKNSVDKTVELQDNLGHKAGDGMLLQSGLQFIPDSCEYTILLQADTWIFDDGLISKYIEKLKKTSSVWASAEWIEKYWSLAVDFAIVNTSFLKSSPDILNFTEHPESSVCNYLLDNSQNFIYINECMPVHRPNIMKGFYNAYGGRFRSFPEAKMVTHHIEDLPDGIEDKKLLANICLNRDVFDVESRVNIATEHKKLRMVMKLASILPRSRWFNKKKRRNLQK
ncbi:MAG: hypothetical protein GF315_01915 [candidate division Zixibacteria bacterium]|nr:hypothetical protein [candidate division Zixibacteria bacterium]